MKVYEIALSSLGIFASKTLPGTLVIEQQQQNDFSIASCSAETITIDAPDHGGAIDSILAPGQILAYVGANDDSVCTPCHSVFRKIVSYDGDNTFTTTLASFKEIFPKKTYSNSLADALIEPMLLCQPSSSEIQSNIQDPPAPVQYHRMLQPDCDAVRFANTLFFIFMFTIILFPIGFPAAIITMFILLVDCDSNDLTPLNFFGFRKLNEARKLDDTIFPTNHKDWFQTDEKGNCLFADCNVGAQMDTSHCFMCDSGDSFCGDDLWELSLTNKMVDIPYGANDRNSAIHFRNAWENQYYCYSSSKFDKVTCDAEFYKAVKESCRSSSSNSSITSAVSFPLQQLDFIESCDMSSILLYLSVNKFGHGVYQTLQSKQEEHQEAVCVDDGK